MSHMSREEAEYEARKTAIRNRRTEQKKIARKKTLRRVFVLFIIAAILTLLVLSLTVFFPVKSIAVEGKTIYKTEQIIRASGIEIGQNLFLTGRTAEEAVVRSLPYVSSVTVKRKFPSKIVLEVKAATAAYCYKTKSGYLLCDKNDKLLEVAEELPEDLLQIIGSTAKKTETGTLVTYEKQEKQALSTKLKAALEEKEVKVTMIDVSDDLDIYLNVEGRFSVTFGSSGNLSSKVAHLSQMVKKIDANLKGTIDLSYWSVENPRGIFTQE